MERYRKNFVSCLNTNKGKIKDMHGVKREGNKFFEGRFKEKNCNSPRMNGVELRCLLSEYKVR